MNEDNKQNEELNEDIAEASGPAQAEGADALLAERDAEIAELKDRLLRAAAETENVRRRLELEKADARSEEHTSELQSLMRISYAVFCLNNNITMHKRKKTHNTPITKEHK